MVSPGVAVLPPTSVVKAQFAALLREGGGSTTDLDVLDCTGAEIPLLCSLLTMKGASLRKLSLPVTREVLVALKGCVNVVDIA